MVRERIGIPVLGYVILVVWFGSVFAIDVGREVTVAGLFQVKETESNNECGNIITSSVQEVEAIKWTFRELNKHNYIDGVTIGLKPYETCGSPDRALEKASDIAFMRSTNTSESCQGSPVVGIIGPEWSDEASFVSKMIGSLPAFSRLPQIGYSTTAKSLSNKELYPNFFRVVPPDGIQIQVIVELMRKLDWTYFAIYYENNKYGQEGAVELELLAKQYGICVPLKIEIDPDKSEEDINDDFNNTLSNLRDGKGNRVGGVIFFGSSRAAQIMVQKANEILSEIPFPVFVFTESINTDKSMFEYGNGTAVPAAKGLYHVNPLDLKIADFAVYWESIFDAPSSLDLGTNSWLLDVNNSIAQCQSEPEVCRSHILTQGVYTQYAIRAALTMAWAIKKVRDDTCGSSSSGLCQEFCKSSGNTFIAALENANVKVRTDFLPAHFSEFDEIDLSITFDKNYDVVLSEESATYEVQNFRKCDDTLPETFCFLKVADFSSTTNELTFNEDLIRDYTSDGSEVQWPHLRKAQCPDDAICIDCTRSSSSDDILHIPGDLYVVGIAPVHNAGNTLLSCGDIRQRDGFDIAEAIIYAVQKAQEQNMLIPSGNIGVILVDSCNDNILVQQKILSLHRFGLSLPDGTSIDINDKIIGYIGAFGSSVSLALADISTRLGYAQISYGSASPLLSDRLLYPWFTRITSSVVEQVPVILRVIQSLGSNLVQLLHSEGAYGEGGADTLIQAVGDYDVCIAQSIAVNDGDQAYFKSILERMRLYPEAKTVIIFLRENALLKFFEVFNTEIELGEFLLIGSESWGIGDFVNGVTKLEGSITIAQVLPVQDGFREHIGDLFPTGNDANKWLEPYMESRLGCYYQWSFNKSMGEECSNDARLDTRVNYRIDSWAPFAIHSVYALLQGARQALETLCPSTSYICDSYKNKTDIVTEKIKEVRLDLTNTQIKDAVFDASGNGNVGYTIYNIQRVDPNSDEMTYREVGRWFSDDGFEFRKVNLVHPSGEAILSRCGDSPECRKCFPPAAEEPFSQTSYIVGIVILSIGLVIVIAVLIFLIRRKGLCSKKPPEDHYDSVENTQNRHYNYLDPRGMVSNGSSSLVQQRDSRFGLESNYQPGLSLSSTMHMDDNEVSAGNSGGFFEDSRGVSDGSYITTTLNNPSTANTVEFTQGRDRESHSRNNLPDPHLPKEDSASSSYADVEEKVSDLKHIPSYEQPRGKINEGYIDMSETTNREGP